MIFDLQFSIFNSLAIPRTGRTQVQVSKIENGKWNRE
jgi:ribosomal protein L18E